MKKKIGDLLLDEGLIDQSQLAEALRMQKEQGVKLGEALIELGYLAQEDIAKIVGTQLGLTQIKLNNRKISKEVLDLVPEQIIRRHRVVPLDIEDDYLLVAMEDPRDLVVIDDLILATGMRIKPVVATQEELQNVIHKYVGMNNLMESATEEFGDVLSSMDKSSDVVNLEKDGDINKSTTIKLVNSIIDGGIKDRASDIHIEPQQDRLVVRSRIDGVMRETMILPKNAAPNLASRIKIMGKMDISERRIPLDGRIMVKGDQYDVDLRISTLPTIFGEKIVIRILDKKNIYLKLSDLGIEGDSLAKYRSLVKSSYGMVLLTGPTGSGKTTTLYSSLREIATVEKNIITVEDPVEYVLPGVNQVGINNKAGLGFVNALRAILRQDPDVIMIGEIRDADTADIAIRAAITGHLVFSTLHTNNAVGAIPRLLDMGIEPFLVSSSLIGVVAQRLVRKICPHCKKAYSLAPSCLERAFMGKDPEEEVILYKGEGCSECHQTGYQGRTVIHELLAIGSEERELITQGATVEELSRAARKKGMRFVKEDGIKKALAGITTIDEVFRVATMNEM